MHDGAQSLCFGFSAGGVDLIHRRGHFAAVANAGGGEELDQVRAFGLGALHQRANLIGRAGIFGDLVQGSEDARTGDRARLDHVAQVAVEGRAHTLHGGESAHQGGVSIGGGVKDGLRLGGLAAAPRTRFVAAVLIEIPGDVDVGIDPPGHDGIAAQVDGRLLLRGSDAGDAASVDDDLLVPEYVALAVDQGAGFDDHRLSYRQGGEAGKCDASAQHGVSRVETDYRMVGHALACPNAVQLS